MSTVPILHKPGCIAKKTEQITGRHGDLLLRCSGCRRFTVTKPADPQPPSTPGAAFEQPPPTPAPQRRGRYATSCATCDRTLYVHRPTPRVHRCDDCQRHATTRRDPQGGGVQS